MQIQLNGEPHQLANAITLSQLVETLSLSGKRLAIEVNQELVPRSQHSTHALKDGDQVEIVAAIGGG